MGSESLAYEPHVAQHLHDVLSSLRAPGGFLEASPQSLDVDDALTTILYGMDAATRVRDYGVSSELAAESPIIASSSDLIRSSRSLDRSGSAFKSKAS